MVFNSQGTPSGECFIQMSSEHAANLASLSLHNKNMEIGKKKRYLNSCLLTQLFSAILKFFNAVWMR